MRVRIVCYEDVNGWILGKFAQNLRNELTALSVSVDIASAPDKSADINHHIIYLDYDGSSNGVDTTMITHIDADWKFRRLQSQFVNAVMGICMSADTMNKLAEAGLPRQKLCYINPAHDNVLRPRPDVVGISTNIYPDGRKRESLLLKVADRFQPDDFMFKIIGRGWGPVVDRLVQRGFAVDYVPEFHRETYYSMMMSIDYFLYLGEDEGSMAFIDALAAGIETIVTPQGFHLDVHGSQAQYFTTEGHLVKAFENIRERRKAKARLVSSWTWQEYARKHLEIWEYLLTGKYNIPTSADGISSVSLLGCEQKSIIGTGRGRLRLIGQSIKRIFRILIRRLGERR